jgi:hypothetical protein
VEVQRRFVKLVFRPGPESDREDWGSLWPHYIVRMGGKGCMNFELGMEEKFSDIDTDKGIQRHGSSKQ